MKTSDLPTARQVARRDLRDPRYLFWRIVQWPRHRFELARLKRQARRA